MNPSYLVAATVVLIAAGSASAGIVDLDFEGVNASYPSGFAFIDGYYDGGTSSDGTTGPNYGVTFSANAQAICLNSPNVVCSNTSRGGLAPSSSEGGLFFLSGSSTTIDVAAGFTTGFSFNYSNPLSINGTVQVYSGLDGSGSLLGSFALGGTPNGSSACPGYGAGFCPFAPIGINFGGTAESIVFGGVANEIVFDDVTFGSSNPGPSVPEPATWALMLTGLAAAGGALRRRRSLATA